MKNEQEQRGTDDFKFCSVCHIEKPISDFYPRRQRKRGYQSECRQCCRVRRSKWWKSSQGKLSSANSKLKARFGISIKEFDKLLEEQDGQCLICGDTESYLGHRLAVDHSHVTGNIRGLLCKACNVGIGNFKDDPDILDRAAKYLRLKDNK